ncbi:DegT/DnrJ/EryC1/StrS family aminotransferase [Euzebya tangerina]|uniref:DegT/DnrJ/EryC1/StrS family aminotransferase n=1 Tax=Euzebya tangerina TaxID=591198 RepID=UPI0013C2EA77|nr:DegT/DnrJ/EryC1/StrS aminotransferase family protein [Euzebya tangerina]
MSADPIPFHRPAFDQAELHGAVSSLESGWLTTGPQCAAFESRFAEAVGAEHAVSVNSCTAALHLALEGLGVGTGDQVVVPAMTFTATAAVVRHLGADPVLVDVEADTLGMDPDQLVDVLSERTKAVVPVHYAGQPAEMDRITSAAESVGAAVVEDSAHCFPGTYREHTIGSLSRATCFSFYANKTITTGEGGMLTTDDAELAERARVMRLHGMSKDAWRRFASGPSTYDVAQPGFKYNMTDLAAAIGLAQLDKAADLAAQRAGHAEQYVTALAHVPGVRTLARRPDRSHAWHLLVVAIDRETFGMERDAVAAALNDRGISTSIHYRPLHRHSYYRDTYQLTDEDFPVASSAGDQILSLPLFPTMTGEQVDRVVAVLAELAA